MDDGFQQPKECNAACRSWPSQQREQVDGSPGFLGNDLGNEHHAGTLDLRANHCIYLHSPTLTHYKVLGPAGSRSVIARVAVNSGYGSILTHQHSGHVLDYIPCGGVTLRTLSCELRNANNELVFMRGGHVSFSIMFSATPLVSKIPPKSKYVGHIGTRAATRATDRA